MKIHTVKTLKVKDFELIYNSIIDNKPDASLMLIDGEADNEVLIDAFKEQILSNISIFAGDTDILRIRIEFAKLQFKLSIATNPNQIKTIKNKINKLKFELAEIMEEQKKQNSRPKKFNLVALIVTINSNLQATLVDGNTTTELFFAYYDNLRKQAEEMQKRYETNKLKNK